ncbi:MAG: RNA polymerase subunit sigma-24 [Chlorobiaceae bacterium]|nr:RNA polymerase subunit sigma-24 [Chlorobiaceae bacterium]NTV60921.1 RNA polymerase subunit sigma-24 [Chlorobiaceae bacterium]
MAIKKTSAELLDDIYTIAYWMTGSEEAASHLVYRTYLNVGTWTAELEVCKSFRDSYFDSYIHEKIACIPQPSCKTIAHLGEVIIQQEADVKLTVLFSEISGLKPCTIAQVIGVPLENIRLWLSSGRRWLAESSLSLNARCHPGVSCNWSR